MKKLLMVVALLGLPTFALVGCGGGNVTVEPMEEDDGSMTEAQQQQYEEMMRSGQGTSQRPGN